MIVRSWGDMIARFVNHHLDKHCHGWFHLASGDVESWALQTASPLVFPIGLRCLRYHHILEPPATFSAPELSSLSMNWGVLWTWKLPVFVAEGYVQTKHLNKYHTGGSIRSIPQFHTISPLYIYISTLYPHSKTMISDYISPLCFQETTWSITWGSFTKHPTPSAPRFPADPGQSGWILTPGVGMSWWFHQNGDIKWGIGVSR